MELMPHFSCPFRRCVVQPKWATVAGWRAHSHEHVNAPSVHFHDKLNPAVMQGAIVFAAFHLVTANLKPCTESVEIHGYLSAADAVAHGVDDAIYKCSTEVSLKAFDSAAYLINATEYINKTQQTLFIDIHARALPHQDGEPEVTASIAVDKSLTTLPAVSLPLARRLFCHVPATVPIVVTLQGAEDVDANLSVKLSQPNPLAVGTSTLVEAHYNQAATALLYVDEDLEAAGEAKVRVRLRNQGKLGVSTSGSKKVSKRAYVVPIDDSHECVQSIQARDVPGCVDIDSLMRCLRSVRTWSPSTMPDPEAISFEFVDKGAVVLSRFSAPVLRKGLWAVFLDSNDYALLEVSLHRQAPRLPLAVLAFLMLVVPLILVITSFYLTKAAVAVCRSRAHGEELGYRGFLQRQLSRWRLWFLVDPDFRSFVVKKGVMVIREGTYVSWMFAGAGAFFVAALQMAFGLWGSSQFSGGRDICYYNHECFVPLIIDVPFNNILSHIPYLVCGFLALVIVMHQEYRVHCATGVSEAEVSDRTTSASSSVGSVAKPNFGVFYALGWGVILEAFGSTCYHICPMPVEFQFDTAMMVVIAVLSTISLANADENSADVPPSSLILLFTLPMWLASFLGTWFDYIVPQTVGNVAYIMYAGALLMWSSGLLWWVARLFPGGHGEKRISKGAITLRVVVFVVLVVVLGFPDVRYAVGGMSNVLLGLSLVTMVIVAFRQMGRHDLFVVASGSRCCRGAVLHNMARIGGKCILLGMTFGVSQFALMFFNDRSTDITKTPAESRSINRPCEFAGAFDTHDMWHALSAIGLALWILVLLETRMRIWKRQFRAAEIFSVGASPDGTLDSRDYRVQLISPVPAATSWSGTLNSAWDHQPADALHRSVA